MPIYEFYCQECNTVYKFFSRTVNTEKIPNCPKSDNHQLSKKVSLFATLSGKKEEGEGEEGMPPIDESKMERAMGMLAREANKINEDDPKQAAQLMKKLTDYTGLKLGPGMEEALHRLEKGEDPEKIEEEMGDLLEEEDPILFQEGIKKTGQKSKPKIDDTLYDM